MFSLLNEFDTRELLKLKKIFFIQIKLLLVNKFYITVARFLCILWNKKECIKMNDSFLVKKNWIFERIRIHNLPDTGRPLQPT